MFRKEQKKKFFGIRKNFKREDGKGFLRISFIEKSLYKFILILFVLRIKKAKKLI